MRYLIVLILVFFSCNDKKPMVKKALVKPIVISKKITPTLDTDSKTDTIVLDYEANQHQADKILIYPVQKTIQKDSTQTIHYNIDFFNKNKKIYTFPYVAKNSPEGEMWSGYDDVLKDTINKKSDKRFINLSLGYPACGYGQKQFLFFLNKEKVSLVKTWTSSGDGPYGDWHEFTPVFSGDMLSGFSSKNITIESDESEPYNDDDEKLVISFKDSIVYHFVDSKWEQTNITPKGKTYRKEKTSFSKYYK